MTTGCDKDVCELVQDTLVELGLRPLTECNGEWPCPNTIENAREIFRAITPDQAQPVMNLLYELSPDKLPIQSSRELLKEDPFQCPEIGIGIYQPCQVSSCAFFTYHPWTRNCLLYYREHKGVTQLSYTDLSFLLNLNLPTVKSTINQAMKDIRKAALKETISQQSESTFTRLEPPNVCVVCESPIEKPFRRTTKYTYCGDMCYLRKPPFVVDLEKEFSLPIERLLSVCVGNFRSPKAIAQALGVTPSKLTHMSKRYCIPLPD